MEVWGQPRHSWRVPGAGSCLGSSSELLAGQSSFSCCCLNLAGNAPCYLCPQAGNWGFLCSHLVKYSPAKQGRCLVLSCQLEPQILSVSPPCLMGMPWWSFLPWFLCVLKQLWVLPAMLCSCKHPGAPCWAGAPLGAMKAECGGFLTNDIPWLCSWVM